jgi:competence protein ComEC
VQQSFCVAGQSWLWDGIRISVLQPSVLQPRAGNNASCVLEIRTGESRALLTGDIELAAEQRLVRRHQLSPTQLVFVPHHGSRTSSHAAFIDQLQPQVALVSAGFGNRWGFPKDDVVQRWRSAGAEVVNTADNGAMSYRMCSQTGLQLQATHRLEKRRIWHE